MPLGGFHLTYLIVVAIGEFAIMGANNKHDYSMQTV